MGYSHYFPQNHPCSPELWARICEDFQTLLANLPAGVTLCYEYDDPCRAPLVNNIEICFNGADDTGYETMLLERAQPGYRFCKTERRPYDIAVCALLILAHHHAPTTWDITSDGDSEDWQPALTWVHETLGTHYHLPPLEEE